MDVSDVVVGVRVRRTITSGTISKGAEGIIVNSSDKELPMVQWKKGTFKINQARKFNTLNGLVDLPINTWCSSLEFLEVV